MAGDAFLFLADGVRGVVGREIVGGAVAQRLQQRGTIAQDYTVAREAAAAFASFVLKKPQNSKGNASSRVRRDGW